MVLDAIRLYPNGTLNELSTVTGISANTIGKITSRLRDRGIIERIGNKRNGYWKVLE